MQIVQNDLPLQAPGCPNTFNDDTILQTAGVNTSYNMVLTPSSIKSEHPLTVLRHEDGREKQNFHKSKTEVFLCSYPH